MVNIVNSPLPPVKSIPVPTEDDINIAVARWNANCLPFYVGLMETQSVTTPNPTAKFLYDKDKMQYIHHKTGRVLTRKEIANAFRYYINKVSTR